MNKDTTRATKNERDKHRGLPMTFRDRENEIYKKLKQIIENRTEEVARESI